MSTLLSSVNVAQAAAACVAHVPPVGSVSWITGMTLRPASPPVLLIQLTNVSTIWRSWGGEPVAPTRAKPAPRLPATWKPILISVSLTPGPSLPTLRGWKPDVAPPAAPAPVAPAAALPFVAAVPPPDAATGVAPAAPASAPGTASAAPLGD